MRKCMLLILMTTCFFPSIAQFTDADKSLAMELVTKNKTIAGLSQADLVNSIVTNTYIIPGTDIRMLYLQQSYQNIPVYNHVSVLAFKNELLVSNSGSRIAKPGLVSNNAAATPVITPQVAVMAAMAECKLNINKPIAALSLDGNKLNYGKLDVATENISAELIWFPLADGNEMKLAWQVFIAPRNSSDYWLIRIDAGNKQVINKESLTVYCNWDKKAHSAGDHFKEQVVAEKINKQTANGPYVVNNANYRVVPYPAESPTHPGGAHVIRTNPWTMAPGNATTLGWHYDGSTHYSSSRGNNVYAYEDRNADNVPGLSAVSTTAQPDLNFNFTPNYTLEPTITSPSPNQQFNTTNLFYWNNLVHDIMYIYGFTEPARNFQNNNQGRGGAGADYVLAEAQDGSGTNNANFATPPDGSRPRMQMYLWNAPTPDRDGDADNGIIIHEYGHGISNRMTGSGSDCLSNAEQMGEGWSDYFALMLTHDWSTALPGDGFSSPRGIGTYALNQPANGAGIRQYRYTTDMSVNPLTYSNLPTVVHPHGTGTVWCTVLWDMTWAIIQAAGINPNLHNIAANGGNAIALKLVTEGLRLQPCSPGFIDGRNAILNADAMFFGGQYNCIIMNAFARRGMGVGASQGSANSRTDQAVSFVGCAPACNAPTGLTSSAITPGGATVGWTAVSGAVSYRVEYKASSSGSWLTAAAATASTSISLAGLSASTLYDWKVRTNCSGSNSAFTQAQFTTATPSVCNTPGGLTSSAITTNSATVSWTDVSGAVSYSVDYKANSSPGWINAITATPSTSVNLTGLSASTLYDWRVRTNCTGDASVNVQAQFTTATPPSTCPGIYDISTNGNTAGAASIPLDTDVKGLINPSGDKDHYRFELSSGGSVTLTLTSLPVNYDLRLLDATGHKIGESKKNGTQNEVITKNVEAGTYYALVYPKGDANHPTLCYTLHVETGAASLGEGEIIVVDRISVFPNPVDKTVTVNIPGITRNAVISIFDMHGRLLLLKNSDQAITQLHVAELPAGFYMLKVSNNGNETNFKIVKK